MRRIYAEKNEPSESKGDRERERWGNRGKYGNQGYGAEGPGKAASVGNGTIDEILATLIASTAVTREGRYWKSQSGIMGYDGDNGDTTEFISEVAEIESSWTISPGFQVTIFQTTICRN